MRKNTCKKDVIVNTHTDGTNCVEENGPVALLQLMKNMKDTQPETFARLIEKIKKIPLESPGKSDGYSIIRAKSVSGGYDFSIKGLADKIMKK